MKENEIKINALHLYRCRIINQLRRYQSEINLITVFTFKLIQTASSCEVLFQMKASVHWAKKKKKGWSAFALSSIFSVTIAVFIIWVSI